MKTHKLQNANAELKAAQEKLAEQDTQIRIIDKKMKEQQFALDKQGSGKDQDLTVLREKDKVIDRLNQEILRKNIRIQRHENTIKQKTNEVEKLLERISNLNKDEGANLTHLSIKDLEHSLHKSNSIAYSPFEWDQNTPFAYAFKFDDMTATLMNGGERYQVVNKYPLSARSLTSFRVDSYGGTTSMGFGIITEDRKKERWSGDQEESMGLLACLNTKRGIVRVNGEPKTEYSSDFFVPEGKELGMEVDLNQLTVGFRVGGGKKMTFSLPEVFSTKRVYAYVMMSSSGDQVEVIQ